MRCVPWGASILYSHGGAIGGVERNLLLPLADLGTAAPPYSILGFFGTVADLPPVVTLRCGPLEALVLRRFEDGRGLTPVDVER